MPQCSYPVYVCRLDAVPGHELCCRHIRLDPNTTYQHCAYRISDNSVSSASHSTSAAVDAFTTRDHTFLCPNAVAPQANGVGESFCADHANEMLARYQTNVDDRLRDDTSNVTASAVKTLTAFDTIKAASGVECWASSQHTASSASLEQFAAASVQSVLDDCEADATYPGHSLDVNNMNVDDVWWGDDGGESDPESVDSETDDVLKYAGVYTAEEFVRLMREKLIRLQKLYIDQFQQLHRDLTEEIRLFRQRSVVETVRRISRPGSTDVGAGGVSNIENAIYDLTAHELIATLNGTSSDGENVTVSTRTRRAWVDSYRRLVALNHYSRPHGLDVILQRMLDEKRQRLTANAAAAAAAAATNSGNLASGKTVTAAGGDGVDGASSTASAASSNDATSEIASSALQATASSVVPCVYSLSTHVRCGQPSLPLARHCLKHILSDSAQVLFRACGAGGERKSPPATPTATDNVASTVGDGGASAFADTVASSVAAAADIDVCPNPVINFVDPVRMNKVKEDGERPSSPVLPVGPVEINRCVFHTLLPESTPRLIAGLSDRS